MDSGTLLERVGRFLSMNAGTKMEAHENPGCRTNGDVPGSMVRCRHRGGRENSKPISPPTTMEDTMTIQLTDQQQQDLSTGATTPRVVDPRTNTTYVLIPEADYESVREILEEERRQLVIRTVGRRNAIGRMGEEP